MTAISSHISRCQLVAGSELIIIEDEADGGERLVAAEQKVARGFAAFGKWPHQKVNLVVSGTFQPLIKQLARASHTLGEGKESAAATFHGLESKPMVHAYNPSDLGETSIFVNREQMKRLGMWDDTEVIEGLLAHEHAHPLSENATTLTARTMKAKIEPADRNPPASATDHVAGALEILAHELCLHAPHEVFANELAICAGFADQLFALNRLNLTGGRSGIEARSVLAAQLKSEVEQEHVSEKDAALILLLASLEAHLPVALETAAFMRAGKRNQANALEQLLHLETFRHVENDIEEIYRQLCTSYGALTANMDDVAIRDWAENTFAPITDAIARHGAHFTVSFHF